MSKIDYKESGVDVQRGYEAVSKIKNHIESTRTKGVLSSIGSFGAMFQVPTGYENPVLVSGTDGVGTKLDLAFMSDNHKTIGIDCVAMCVNDIACLGAKPLFFLDYIATGKINPSQIEDIVSGISKGCMECNCAIIGGETAEMPDFYKAYQYDLAGFAVGIVEKSKIIKPENTKTGDVLIGVESSGIHSNGFSLVRKLCFKENNFTMDTYIDELGCKLGEELLKPTIIYVSLIERLLEKFEINSIAHITGGGWIENIPRILNEDQKAVVNIKNHKVPKIFSLLQNLGNLENMDMYNTFNMGIGLVLSVNEEIKDKVISEIEKTNKAYLIGKVAKKDGDEKIEFL